MRERTFPRYITASELDIEHRIASRIVGFQLSPMVERAVTEKQAQR